MQLASMSRAALPAHPSLSVPDDIAAGLGAAVAAGQSDASAWFAAHPGGTSDELARAAQATVPHPEADVSEELARMHRMQSHVSKATMKAAEWFSTAGQPSGKLSRDSWWTDALDSFRDAAIAAHGRAQGTRDAARAAELLQQVLKVNDDATFSAKYALPEARPYTYAKDAKPPKGGWAGQDLMSHPSGHSSRAYAAATLLGRLWPAHAAELLDVAAGVAHSRLLEDMHFPHDVAMGARIGTFVANAMLDQVTDEPILS